MSVVYLGSSMVSNNNPNGHARSLVIIQLSGGNDYLNTLVPYENGFYHDFRHTVKIEPEQILKIDDQKKEEVAFDIVNHRSAPPGLRIWAGATVESEDILRLLPWIDWAHQKLVNETGDKNA